MAYIGSTPVVTQVDGYNRAEANLEFVRGLETRLFHKDDATEVAWTKTGNDTAETQTDLFIEVNDTIVTFASGTSITMPSLSAGTDYAIWAKPDGGLEATSNHTSPPVANARKVGGFHYAPGFVEEKEQSVKDKLQAKLDEPVRTSVSVL